MKVIEGYTIEPQVEAHIVRLALDSGYSARKIEKREKLPRKVINAILQASEAVKEAQRKKSQQVEQSQLGLRVRSHLMDRIEKAFRCAQSGQTQKPSGSFNSYGDAMDATGTVDRIGIRGVLTNKEFCEEQLYVETLTEGRSIVLRSLRLEIEEAREGVRESRAQAVGVAG